MTNTKSQAPQEGTPSGKTEKLDEGTIVAGRYRIERMLGWGGLGPLYRAQDNTENKPVAVRVFSSEITSQPELVERIRAIAGKISSIEHKNVIQIYKTGFEENLFYMVLEYLDGQPMRVLLEKKARAKKTFTLKGAFNVVAHLSNGLNQFESMFSHGALHPRNIMVSRSGRIKVADTGFVHALAPIGDVIPYLAEEESRYVAPEVTADPLSADGKSDVFSIGVLLGELLTGISPDQGFKNPSEVIPNLTANIDAVVNRCRNMDPSERYLSPMDMKEAMLDVIQTITEKDRISSQEIQAASAAGTKAAPEKSESTGIEIDIVAEPVPGPASPPPLKPGAGFGPGGQVTATQPGIAGIPPTIRDPFPPMSSGEFDLASLVDETASEDEERYLIQQGKLDFGPFSSRELKVQIRIGEVKGNDMVVDNLTGNRVKVKDHPELGKYFRGVERHKELQRRAATQSATQESEKRKKKVFWGVGAGAAAVVGLVVGGIFLYKGVQAEESGPAARDRSELRYETSWDGDEEIDESGKKTGRGRRRRKGGGWKGGEWDDKQVIDFGSGSGTGEGETLSRGQIQSVMSRFNNRIGGCLVKHSQSNVTINLQISGSGKLTAVRTTVSGAADRCIKSAIQGAQFPKFNGVRTTGSYSLRVSN